MKDDPENRKNEEHILLLKNIAINNEQEDIYRLLDIFLEFSDEHIKPFTGKGVPDEDLRQECALVMSEELLEGVFLEKADRRERIITGSDEDIRSVFAELIHDISASCEKALADLTEQEENSKKAGLEILAKVNMIDEGAKSFYSEYGMKATPSELADYLDIDEDIIIEAVELSGYEISYIDFDMPPGGNTENVISKIDPARGKR